MKKTVTLILSSAILFSFANFESEGLSIVRSIKDRAKSLGQQLGVGKGRNAQQAMGRLQRLSSNLQQQAQMTPQIQSNQNYTLAINLLNEVFSQLNTMTQQKVYNSQVLQGYIQRIQYGVPQQNIPSLSQCLQALNTLTPDNEQLIRDIVGDLQYICNALGSGVSAQVNSMSAAGYGQPANNYGQNNYMQQPNNTNYGQNNYMQYPNNNTNYKQNNYMQQPTNNTYYGQPVGTTTPQPAGYGQNNYKQPNNINYGQQQTVYQQPIRTGRNG